MSQWRRIALEAVPSCKKAIEEADNPNQMWIDLYSELYSSNPAEEMGNKQIYDFALRCFRTKKPTILSAAVWLFFDYVVGGYFVGIERLRKDLPGRISVEEFQYWAQIKKNDFSEEVYDEAVKEFHRAKHNPRLRS